jgi:ribonuclease E
MPADGSPDTPMAVIVDDAAEAAPVALAEEPKRRRVRRKVSGSATSEVEPNEIESMAEPAVLDVTPAEAAAEVEPEPAPEPVSEPVPEPKVAAVVEPKPAPQPEVDVAALIAEDPNQIVAPPEKPKRGWWRR